MAIVWGSWASGSTTNKFRVGIDLSVSGTTITAKYYAESLYTVDDGQTLTRTGAITGSTTFQMVQGSSGGSRLVTTQTRTGTRGTSYSFGASISGIYNGASPSVSGVSITVPAAAPSKPGKPTIAVDGVGRIKLSLSAAPANNGASITRYEWDLEPRTFNDADRSTGLSFTFTSLANATSFTGRVRAVNSAGSSPWSDYSNAATTPGVPNKPAKPTVTVTGTTTATGAINALPASNGSTLTRLEWLIEGGSWVNGTLALTRALTGMVGNTSYRLKVRARNAVGVSAESDWSNTFTTQPVAPAAPGTPTVTRNSDTSHTLSWVRNVTGPAPYVSQPVQRRVNSGSGWGGWITIFTATGTATSHTDTTTVANQEYQYRIQATNAANTATSGTSATVRTTPAAPTGLAATKANNGDISVAGTAVAASSTTIYEWQDSPGGTGYVTVAGTTTSPSRVFATPNPLVTHQYRARARLASGGANSTTLYSNWSAGTGVVQLLAPPLAPTITSPTASSTLNEAANIGVNWTHNPVDSSAQRAYELRYRSGGGAWVVLSGTTAKTRSIPALNTRGPLEIQVRTKGTYTTSPTEAEWSPWSAVRTVTLAPRPLATIESPSGVINTAYTSLVWNFFAADGSTQVSYTALLVRLSDNTVLETRVGSSATSQVFTSLLEDGENYRFDLTLVASNTLSSSLTTETFSVLFLLPFSVDVAPSPDPEWGRVELVTETGYFSSSWEEDEDNSSSLLYSEGELVAINRWPNPSMRGAWAPPGARVVGEWLYIEPEEPSSYGYGEGPYGVGPYGGSS